MGVGFIYGCKVSGSSSEESGFSKVLCKLTLIS